jgi:phage protein D
MMDNAPDKRVAERRGAGEKPKDRVWKNATVRSILESKASTYRFALDVDDYAFGRSITQKPGMSDYDLVRGLANFLGYLFWVDATEAGQWVLHFKDPKRSPPEQEKKYTFRYDHDGDGALLTFKPEYALRDARTKVRVETRDPDTGKELAVVFEDDAAQPDLQSTGDPFEEVDIGITTGGAVKLFWGDFSLEVLASKNFRTSVQLQLWAEQWFKRNREDFVTGTGSIIGVETVMARQTHRLEGLGRTLDGDYYFTKARHTFGRDEGYKLEFAARKVITDSRNPQAQAPRRPPNTRTYRAPAF